MLLLLLPLMFACDETTPSDPDPDPCSCDPSIEICVDETVCEADYLCYATVCYSKDNEVLGIKKLDASFNSPLKEITSGKTTELQVKVLRAGTDAMPDGLMVGPVANEMVQFDIKATGNFFISDKEVSDQDLKTISVKTDERGVATAYFTGTLDTERTIPVISSVANCPTATESDCVRTFQVTVNPVTTSLYLAAYNGSGSVTDEVVNITVPPFKSDLPDRTLLLGAYVRTNQDDPYKGQDVTFKLDTDNGAYLYDPENPNTQKTSITVKTDQVAALAQVHIYLPELADGTTQETFNVDVTKDGTASKRFNITLTE